MDLVCFADEHGETFTEIDEETTQNRSGDGIYMIDRIGIYRVTDTVRKTNCIGG